MNPQISSDSNQLEHKTFVQKYKFTLISLLIIVLAAIPLLLLSNRASKKMATNTVTPTAPVTPTSAPMTQSNIQPTLTQTDADMQTTLGQMDTDLQNVSKIDTSQDSTTGL